MNSPEMSNIVLEFSQRDFTKATDIPQISSEWQYPHPGVCSALLPPCFGPCLVVLSDQNICEI